MILLKYYFKFFIFSTRAHIQGFTIKDIVSHTTKPKGRDFKYRWIQFDKKLVKFWEINIVINDTKNSIVHHIMIAKIIFFHKGFTFLNKKLTTLSKTKVETIHKGAIKNATGIKALIHDNKNVSPNHSFRAVNTKVRIQAIQAITQNTGNINKNFFNFIIILIK